MATDTKTEAKPSLTVEEEMEMIRTAPIMDVAAYFGDDLDLAVQMRVDSAVEDTYYKISARIGPIATDIYKKWAAELEKTEMEVVARPVEPHGNLYGFASVTIGGVTMHDFKIVADKDDQLFVGMPSKPDKTSKTGYRNTVSIDKNFREEFSKVVLSAHYDAVEKFMERAEKYRSKPEKPERIADQIEKAENEVTKANAAHETPDKKKVKATRDDR